MRNAYVLNDEEATEIVKLGKALEAHFGQPQDLEWAIDRERPFPGNVYLLQTRAVVGVKAQEEKATGKKVIQDLVQSLFM